MSQDVCPVVEDETGWRRQTTVEVTLAGKILGVSRNTAYAGVKSGDIPSIRIESRILVPVAGLRRMLGEVAP